MKNSAGFFALVLFVAGCRPLDVNLSATEPIVVDVNMRVDVYERGGARVLPAWVVPPKGAAAAPEGAEAGLSPLEPAP